MAATYPDSQVPRARSARRQFWLDHLRAWQAQGTSLRAYAAANGLSSSSLYRARRRLERRGLLSGSEDTAPAFVPVRVTAPAPACRVLLPNGVVVEVSSHAVEAAILATEQAKACDGDVRRALIHELEQARYEAALAARRHEVVDPEKRLVARELEARWNSALERVVELEERLAEMERRADAYPGVDRPALMALAHDLPAAWNAPHVQPHTKQRLAGILIQEVVIDVDDVAHESVIVIHWSGGRHSELRLARRRTSPFDEIRRPSAVEAVRTLAEHYGDRELAVTLNRMRCKTADGQSWTAVRVGELRKRLGIAAFDSTVSREETITADKAASRLGICVGSVHRLIREGILPATQLMPWAPWQIPVAALGSEPVRAGIRAIIERRPRNMDAYQDDRTIRLPGL